MQKEMNAAYFDAVVRHDRKHAARWIEVRRRGGVVILGRAEDVRKKAEAERSAGVAMPDMREGEQPAGDGMHARAAHSGSPVSGDNPKRRGRPKKEKRI